MPAPPHACVVPCSSRSTVPGPLSSPLLPPCSVGRPGAGRAPPGRKLAAVPAPRPLTAAARRTGPLAAALALVLAGAGCTSFDRTFGQQQAVVQFRPQTP